MKLKILAIRESRGLHILNPLHAAEAMTEEAMADRECFWVLHLATSHKVIEKEIVAIGILSSTLIHPREVFKKAIMNSAASIITVHNHPSGSLSPSPEDRSIWRRLSDAGKILG
jgi:DNA repair protein RadC